MHKLIRVNTAGIPYSFGYKTYVNHSKTMQNIAMEEIIHHITEFHMMELDNWGHSKAGEQDFTAESIWCAINQLLK